MRKQRAVEPLGLLDHPPSTIQRRPAFVLFEPGRPAYPAAVAGIFSKMNGINILGLCQIIDLGAGLICAAVVDQYENVLMLPRSSVESIDATTSVTEVLFVEQWDDETELHLRTGFVVEGFQWFPSAFLRRWKVFTAFE